jgi:ABC-2 type transport system ATP-binding protein
MMISEQTAIIAEDVRKRFGGQDALSGFGLHVPVGRVCGLLGPNGAGKTTAVRILSTLLRADRGRVEVAGFDAMREPAQVRRNIGLVGQHAAVDEVLSGRENLVMFGRLHHLTVRAARTRADELLERFDLEDTGERPVDGYSGGMRRRLDLAAGLIVAPPVLFLDEPTAGLDPRGRSEMWQAIRSLVGSGVTVLLTTQYLEEADELADQITVIDHGRVIAEGTPRELKRRLGGDRVEVVVHRHDDLALAGEALTAAAGAPADVDRDALRVSAPSSDRVHTLTAVAAALSAAQITAADIAVREPTLDEVFLDLTSNRDRETTR